MSGRIRSIEVLGASPRWQFVKLTTDEGVTGWSEGIVEGRARTVGTAISELSEFLVGQDASRIEHLWQRMYADAFWRGGPVLMTAIAAIDNALWDVKARSLGVPVYELLGGRVRDNVPAYCHIAGESPEDLAADAQRAISAGFTRFKTAILPPPEPVPTVQYVDQEIARILGLRESLGSAYEFGVDFHGRATPVIARTLVKEFEPARLMFVEEPCLPENMEAMAGIRSVSSVPIATGERLFTKWQYQDAISRGVADIYQPDLIHAGGITETQKIGALAEANFVHLAPHNPLGPLSLATAVQFALGTSSFVYQELPGDLGTEYLAHPFTLEAGSIVAPDGPGLGIEVDEAQIRANAQQDVSKLPPAVYRDGSVGNW